MKRKLFSTISFLLLILFLFAGQAAGQTVSKPWEIYNTESPMTRLMAKFYGIEENQVVATGQNCHYPDDLMVTLYLWKNTGLSPHRIQNWRKEARSWTAIMESANYPVHEIFIKTASRPTASFAHAYGQYARWKKNPQYKITVYDKEIRNLIGLRFMVEKFGISPLEAMQSRENESSFTKIIMERI